MHKIFRAAGWFAVTVAAVDLVGGFVGAQQASSTGATPTWTNDLPSALFPKLYTIPFFNLILLGGGFGLIWFSHRRE